MANEIALLPCPFCGGGDVHHAELSPEDMAGGLRPSLIECMTCDYQAEGLTPEIWNKRATTKEGK